MPSPPRRDRWLGKTSLRFSRLRCSLISRFSLLASSRLSFITPLGDWRIVSTQAGQDQAGDVDRCLARFVPASVVLAAEGRSQRGQTVHCARLAACQGAGHAQGPHVCAFCVVASLAFAERTTTEISAARLSAHVL
jgi:hypothetical protein